MEVSCARSIMRWKPLWRIMRIAKRNRGFLFGTAQFWLKHSKDDCRYYPDNANMWPGWKHWKSVTYIFQRKFLDSMVTLHCGSISLKILILKQSTTCSWKYEKFFLLFGVLKIWEVFFYYFCSLHYYLGTILTGEAGFDQHSLWRKTNNNG